MPLDVSRAPAAASPLWVIALFIALSEATAGIAAITTDGTARLIFACFAVTFPTVVFTVFVWMLVKHAPNLYSPGQYSRDITPQVYRVGISAADSALFGRAVAETVAPLFEETTEGEAYDAVVEKAVRRFAAAVEESSVIVSLDPLKPGAEPLQIPVTKDTRVGEFLNSIYFELSPAVDPFTYDVAWILVDDHGVEYTDIGTRWADERNLGSDTRLITAVGIEPGSHLTTRHKSRSGEHK